MTTLKYYVYVYLRRDGSPYYVGKGSNGRWKASHRVEVPPEDRVIFLITNTTEEWAHFMEMEFIDKHGRLNDGTGILENWTDGGEGTSGAEPWNKGKSMSEDFKILQSKIHKGIPKPPRSKEHAKKIGDANRGRKQPREAVEITREKNKRRYNTPEYAEWKDWFLSRCQGNNKGIVRTEEQKKTYRHACSRGNVYHFIDPNGEQVTIKGSLNYFCKNNNLNTGAMSQVHLGNKPHHKSWRKA